MTVASTPAATASLADVDVSDLSWWDDGPPHELFTRLRREAPVHFSPLGAYDEPGFWSLTRWEDVAAVSRDTKTFSNERGGMFLLNDIGIPLEIQQQQMISMDPPRHDRMKALVQRGFTPKRIDDHARRIEAIVSEALDALAAADVPDLVAEVATVVPSKVISEFLGVPDTDTHKLVEWTSLITGYEDPNLRPSFEDGMRAFTEMHEYVTAMAASRRADPVDDLVSALVHAQIDGEGLADVELTMFFGLLMVGGNDSTRATYSGGMYSLMTNPDQREVLIEDPRRLPAAVEEILRHYPAFNYFRRTATRDLELHGQQIREGDKVALWYASSCRDETVIDDPSRFDITRTDLKHQAFGGGGRHFCLGAALARLELSILIRQTLDRFPGMAVTGTPTRACTTMLSQHLTLPVRLA